VVIVINNARDFKKIIKECRRNLKKDPLDVENLKKLGWAQYNLMQHKDAINTYQKYLNVINPQDYEIWNSLGIVYQQKGDKNSAINAFKRALEFNQEFDLAWANLAKMHIIMKNHDDAIRNYKEALRINPQIKLNWYELAMCQFNQKLYDDAVDSFKAALRLDKTYDLAWENLAEAYKKLKEKEKSKLAKDHDWNLLEIRYIKQEEREKIEELEKNFLKAEKLIQKDKLAKAINQLEKIIQEAKKFNLEEFIKKANKQLEQCTKTINEQDKADRSESVEKELEKALIKVGKFVKKEQYTRAKSMLYSILQQATEYNLDVILTQANREFDVVDKLEFEQRFEIMGEIEGEDYKKTEIEVLRGGDWKVEDKQSVFYYKPKVINNSKYVISNIQILLTDIPNCLEADKDRYKIEYLKPRSFESPTFKLRAIDSCVGDSVTGIVTFTNPAGKQETIHINPFEIEYVCNLLVPKKISRKDYDKKVEHMKGKELKLDCLADPKELESLLTPILLQNNFYLLEQLKSHNDKILTLDGYAQGRYDKEDVALSLTMEKREIGTQLVIKGMSDRIEKITDILKDISVKCDDIKSDTELIKEYSAQIEEALDKIDDLEEYIRKRIGSVPEKLRAAIKDYKEGKISKGKLVITGFGVLGKSFASLFPVVRKVVEAFT
jgi:cytochrome c-type biogenesis protein CcmH/NrfG